MLITVQQVWDLSLELTHYRVTGYSEVAPSHTDRGLLLFTEILINLILTAGHGAF